MDPGTTRSSCDLRPLRCYLVEDSPLIRRSLIATLEDMVALEVIGTAEDEATAKAWLDTMENTFDLIIVDIFLKQGSGLEVLRRARELHPQVHLAVLTNYATADMRRRCTAMGADRVFDKSAELEELLAYCSQLAQDHQ